MTLAIAILLLQAAMAATPPHAGMPFAVGERLEYQGRHTIFRPGTAVLSVDAIESWQGVPHWKFSFTSSVSFLGFKSRTELVSWTGVGDFMSRRFTKTMEENGRRKFEDFRIHPDSGFFRRGDDTVTKRTAERPLDDVAFFYWIRTIPLQMGET